MRLIRIDDEQLSGLVIEARDHDEVAGRHAVDVVRRVIRAGFARLAMVNGRPGLIVAPRGRLRIAVAFEVANGRVAAIDVIADPDRLRTLELAVVPGG